MNLNTCTKSPELEIRSLAFSEKFTTLYKVIANTLIISNPVENIGIKAFVVAITLLNFPRSLQKIKGV